MGKSFCVLIYGFMLFITILINQVFILNSPSLFSFWINNIRCVLMNTTQRLLNVYNRLLYVSSCQWCYWVLWWERNSQLGLSRIYQKEVCSVVLAFLFYFSFGKRSIGFLTYIVTITHQEKELFFFLISHLFNSDIMIKFVWTLHGL